MNTPIELATKIVVLLTALVGLFVVARGSAKGVPPAAGNGHAFTPLLRMTGTLAMMLALPLAMLAYMWIMSKMIHVFDRPEESTALASIEADSLARAWGIETEAAYAMLVSAEQMESLDRKDAVLVNAARVALQHRRPEIAWLAGRRIRSLDLKDSVLVSTVGGFLRRSDYIKAASVLRDISSVRIRDQTAELIANSAARHGYPAPAGPTRR